MYSASTRVFDLYFRKSDDRGDRSAKFLAYEGCDNALEAMVLIGHFASTLRVAIS